MAKFQNLTVSYKDIAANPLPDKQQLATASLGDILSRLPTPGQRSLQFPRYSDYTSSNISGSATETSSLGGSGSPLVPPTRGNVPAGTNQPLARPQVSTADLIPAGLIPGPDGKPMRVPDQKTTTRRSGGAFKDRAAMEAYIQEAAKVRGIDPEVAMKLYRAEGASGQGPSLQSLVQRNGKGSVNGYEDSHGPFQLYRGGGLGNDFEAKTGLKVDDPATFRQQIDFALDYAAVNGWGQWSAARSSFPDMRYGISVDASPQGISEFGSEGEDIVTTEQLQTAFDQNIETADPLYTSKDGSSSDLIPAGVAENDAIINPELRVNQVQKEVAAVRKGDLDPDLANTLALSAQRTSENTGRNLSFRVTSGGQRMAGAEGATGTHEHDDGGAADFNIIETLEDGSTRVLDPRVPADKLIINQAVYNFSSAGGRSVGSEYMSDPTKLHFGISRHNPAAYAGTDDFKESFESGRSSFLETAKSNNFDPDTGYRDVYRMERENRIDQYNKQAEQIKTNQDTADALIPQNTDNTIPDDNTAPIPEATSNTSSNNTAPIPAKKTSLTEMVHGYSAAAGGAIVNEPSMIISEDGKKATRIAETGPEKIEVIPRHSAKDVSQQPWQEIRDPVERSEVVQQAEQQVPDKEQQVPQMNPNFGAPLDRPSGSFREVMKMPRVTLSAGKAYADAKFVDRFNKADVDGDMGMVYVDRGYV